MNKLICGLVVGFMLSGVAVWADDTVLPSTLVAVATPKPMPPDVKAARDKWLNAKAQEIQTRHDRDTVKLKHQVTNSQKCLSEAQTKKDADKVTKYQAKLAALDKIQADQDQILSFRLDQVKALRADDKSDALNDTDQINSLKDDIKEQWQSMK